MPRRIVSVDDSFNIQPDVKVLDGNLPTRLGDPALGAAYASNGVAATSAKPRKPLLSNMVTTFASGHGWFNYAGAATFTANDTTDYALGTQSVKIVTDTINTAAITRSPALTVDLTSKQIVIWVKVTGVANLTEMNLYAGDSTLANHYNWTIADAGGVAQHVFREGEWAPIVLGFADAFVVGSPSRSAITLMQFRVRASSGNAITVNVGGIGLTAELSTFPKGVISIACDDSYLSQYTQLKTALDKYGWGATAYTIVDRLGVAGFMTLANLKELEAVHGWEIAGHSYTMANHAIGYGNMTDAEVEADIKKLKTWLIDNNFIGADHMAYPLGSFTSASQAVIGKYFATGRTVTNRLIETIRPSDRMRLRSLSVSNTIPLSTAKALVDKVAAQKGWGIITLHDIVATPTVGTHWSIADTFALIDYIATKDVVVMNVGDVVTRLSAPSATAAATDTVTGTVLHAAMGNASGKLNALARAEASAGVATLAGRADLIAFTPVINMTITKLTAMTSGTAWTGHTLARMGLYTVDTAGAVTLVAQTASDTTLFIAAQTAYQRSLDTTGGFPASYALVAGQRYAVGVIGVGQTAGQLRGGSSSSVLAQRAPIMGGTIGSGLTDLPTTGTITATGNYPWAELAA